MHVSPIKCIAIAIALVTVLSATACQRGEEPDAQAPPQVGQAPAAPVEAAPAPTTVGDPVAPLPAPTVALVEQYAAQAQALSAQLTTQADSAAAIAASGELLDLSVEIAPAFIERHPHCRDYLNAAMAVETAWQQMDAATLERDFHKDGALPEVVGDAQTCYHMKDLIVHPATALALLSQSPPDIETARREIAEVIAHAHVVKSGR